MGSVNALAAVRDIGFRPPHLGYLETVGAFRVTQNDVTLNVERVKGRSSGFHGRDFIVTHRGVTMYAWRYLDGRWIALEPITLWRSVPEEFYAS